MRRSEENTERIRRTGRWPVRLVGLLLILQALALIVYGMLPGLLASFASDLFVSVQHDLSAEESAEFSQALEELSLLVRDRRLMSTFSQLLGLVGLVAGVGVLFRWRPAWTLAMALQGLDLVTAIGRHYLADKPPEVYLAMAFGIFVVACLNSSGVSAAFRPRQVQVIEEKVR
jgi:hypothetical protein